MRCARCHLESKPSRSDALYCSTKCRVYAGRLRDAIPAQLRDRDRWVRFNAKKVPLQPNGVPARSNDSTTWSSFDAVLASRQGVGIGFMLDGDGIVCVDLDNAIDARGRIKPWAREILDSLPATFTEVSPSGRGLHIWGFGKVDTGRRWVYADGGVEVYGTLRYLTVTGRKVRNTPAHLALMPDLVKMMEDRCGLAALLSPLNSIDVPARSGRRATGIVLEL